MFKLTNILKVYSLHFLNTNEISLFLTLIKVIKHHIIKITERTKIKLSIIEI